MTAYELFKALRTEKSFWSKQTDKMVWLACRYYSGADSREDLERLGQPMPVMADKWTGGDRTIPPALTYGQVVEIIRSR